MGLPPAAVRPAIREIPTRPMSYWQWDTHPHWRSAVCGSPSGGKPMTSRSTGCCTYCRMPFGRFGPSRCHRPQLDQEGTTMSIGDQIENNKTVDPQEVLEQLLVELRAYSGVV